MSSITLRSSRRTCLVSGALSELADSLGTTVHGLLASRLSDVEATVRALREQAPESRVREVPAERAERSRQVLRVLGR